MKNLFSAILLSTVLFSCSTDVLERKLTPRDLKVNEEFNEIPNNKANVFSFVESRSNSKTGKNEYFINYKDTLVSVELGEKQLLQRFVKPEFLNSQKTAVIVQASDSAGLASPFYILAANKGKLEAILLDRPFKNKRKNTGLEKISRANFIINNDYLVTSINGKVYPIKRQIEDEPIKGKIFMLSKDGTTLVFLTNNSFYQYNYKTGESFNLPIPASLVNNKESIFGIVQRDYTWADNKNGTPFLKERFDDNRIVDIKEFKH
jgi:hypothetical protein